MNTKPKRYTKSVLILLTEEQYETLQLAFAAHLQTFSADEAKPTRGEFVRDCLMTEVRQRD